jgi:hypothetical protein
LAPTVTPTNKPTIRTTPATSTDPTGEYYFYIDRENTTMFENHEIVYKTRAILTYTQFCYLFVFLLL